MSKFNGVKTNNAKNKSKVTIRQIAFDSVNEKNVLDVFCGSGEMFNSVWKNAQIYQGIDNKITTHNKNVLIGDYLDCLRTIRVSDFSIFDIDAYGSPYKALNYIIDSLKSCGIKFEKIAFVITDGIEIDMRMGNFESAFAKLANINLRHIKGANNLHDFFIKKLISNIAKETNTKIISTAFTKGITGAGMRYYTFTLMRL